MSKIRIVHVESVEENDNAIIETKSSKKWQSYFWDTLDKSPEERNFLFKLDAVLLTFASLGKIPSPKKKDSRIAKTKIRRIFYQVS